MKIGKYKFHFFKINEKKRFNGHLAFLFAMRYFLHVYKVYWSIDKGVWSERSIFDGHTEIYLYRWGKNHSRFSSRFHIGNLGSESPWDGHLSIGPFAIYWGHNAFRRLANWLSRCGGYQWDTREWMLQLTEDWRLRWQFANHSDMCDTHRKRRQEAARNRGKKVHRLRSLREGYLNLNIPDHIWGPVRYTYEDAAHHGALLKFPDGEYGVILTLQRLYKGRTKVDRKKHEMSWSIDVEAPKGVPTHYDSSGGWKGDRSYGWSVPYPYASAHPDFSSRLPLDWEENAERLVTEWVLNQRQRTGFTEPLKEES